MRLWGKGWKIAITMAVLAVAVYSVAVTQSSAQAPAAIPGLARIAGKPDFSGIWEANNTANWDLQSHEPRPMVGQPGYTPGSTVLAAPVLALGADGWVPGGLGVVEGEEIPYQPWAAARKKENLANWIDRDPELKCFQPGIPRAMYQPYPFQIIQSDKSVQMIYEFANAQRTIHLNKMDPYPNNAYMGYSTAKWVGDTLVTDVSDFTDATWFDRAGNFHSDALHVVERFTPISRDAIQYGGHHRRQAGLHAAVEDQHAALPASRKERAVDGVPLRGDGGRNHVRASSQGSVGEALGRPHHERRHHAQDPVGRGRVRALHLGQSADAAREMMPGREGKTRIVAMMKFREVRFMRAKLTVGALVVCRDRRRDRSAAVGNAYRRGRTTRSRLNSTRKVKPIQFMDAAVTKVHG